jgi:hypothetical protein
MPDVNPGEIWMTDFGMAAKVRPALILTGAPAADELDLVTRRVEGLFALADPLEMRLAKTRGQVDELTPSLPPPHCFSAARAIRLEP